MSLKPFLTIIPIGGAGQIGSNMTVIQNEETTIVIDCGILFPREHFFSIDYLVPDFSKLKFPISNLIITHGHEDHIGAIPMLVKYFSNITIWSPPFASELISSKLNFIKHSCKINTYKKYDQIKIANLIISPIELEHSIPDTFGIHIEVKSLSLSMFYCSDFKLSNNPKTIKELLRLKEISRKSELKLLMPDSTNITSNIKKTKSEQDIIPTLHNIISEAKSMIVLTCFSSNIERLNNIACIAKQLNRTVYISGKSLQSYITTATKLGYLNKGDFKFSISPNLSKAIIIASGCQCDFNSSFRRIASLDHPNIKPQEGDTFIFSSKTIPGNEKQVSATINQLIENKINVILADEHEIHVSGHAGIEDLNTMYETFAPNYSIPIHGESLFLKKHCEFIDNNWSETKSVFMTNYDELHVNSDKQVTLLERDSIPPILIHGDRRILSKEMISNRRKLATKGLVILNICKKSRTFNLELKGIQLNSKDETNTFNEIITENIKTFKFRNPKHEEQLLRTATGHFFKLKIGYAPVMAISFI